MTSGCDTVLVTMLAQPFVSFDSNDMCKHVSSPTHASAKQIISHESVFFASNMCVCVCVRACAREYVLDVVVLVTLAKPF